jgi:alpha-beta hydrolase superfamily lysophospholipase
VLALAQRFVEELSRPGVRIEDVAPELVRWDVPTQGVEPPADRIRALEFAAPGGPRLRGEFWAQPRPAPTIVICHGYRVDRARMRPVAALEYAHGSNTLLFDFRGHGESADAPTSGGNAEVHDLAAALDAAVDQPETLPGQLFIHGFSMGAAVALLLPPRTDVAGIIADSPYARLDDILCRLVTWQLTAESARWSPPLRRLRVGFPALARVTFAASDLIFRLRFHHPLIARPAASVRAWGGRLKSAARGDALYRPPILLIHALGDPLIPVEHALRIALAARTSGVPLTLHFAESDVHCGAYGSDPERYVAVLRRFVESATPPTPNLDNASRFPGG